VRFSLARQVFIAIVLSASDARAQLPVGTPAPEIDVRTLGGARFQLSALRGRPVVMTFWGTWCPPCREEFPQLAGLYGKHHAAGLEIVAVNQRDQELSTSDVQHFVDEFSIPFTVVLDPRGRSRRSYRLFGLPTTVFVDTAGVIRRVVSGPLGRDQLGLGLAAIGITR
jgi:cytochrome c biogenesis protein CcmG/thiol:disulfide interchange protein DsbE